MTTGPDEVTWLSAIRRYLVAVAAGNLLWEFAQMPLYTLGQTGTFSAIILAGLHCTAGDILISLAALLAALVLCGSAGWPGRRFWSVAITAVVTGASYTVFSEYLNTVVRGSWTYSSIMPTLPWLGTGLAPLAQWLLIPPIALAWAAGKLSKEGDEPNYGRYLFLILLVTVSLPAAAGMARDGGGGPAPDAQTAGSAGDACTGLPHSSLELYDLHAAPLERVVVDVPTLLPRRDTRGIVTQHSQAAMVMAGELATLVNVEHRVLPASGGSGSCDAPVSVRIGVGYASRHVYMAWAAADDRCVQETLMTHAEQHAKAEDELLATILEAQAEAIGKQLAEMKRTLSPTPEAAQANFMAGSLALAHAARQQFLSLAAELNAGLDGPEEMRRLNAACDGRVGQIGMPTRRPT